MQIFNETSVGRNLNKLSNAEMCADDSVSEIIDVIRWLMECCIHLERKIDQQSEEDFK